MTNQPRVSHTPPLTAHPTTMNPMAHPAYDHRWQQLRREWHHRLLALWATDQTWTCRKCSQPITTADATTWQLGHATAKAYGGTTAGAEPEHRHCNAADGARLGNSITESALAL